MRRARHGAHASRVLQRGSTEMPTVAMSPSSLAHSCDLAYLMDMNRGAVNVKARAACGATRRVPATLHCVHAGRRTRRHTRATLCYQVRTIHPSSPHAPPACNAAPHTLRPSPSFAHAAEYAPPPPAVWARRACIFRHAAPRRAPAASAEAVTASLRDVRASDREPRDCPTRTARPGGGDDGWESAAEHCQSSVKKRRAAVVH